MKVSINEEIVEIFQKKLIASSKLRMSVAILHFLHAILMRLPWLKSCNKMTLTTVCGKIVDFAVENYSADVIRYFEFASGRTFRLVNDNVKLMAT